jgi:hypothetical protein
VEDEGAMDGKVLISKIRGEGCWGGKNRNLKKKSVVYTKDERRLFAMRRFERSQARGRVLDSAIKADPEEPYAKKRVIRGGSFLCNESYCTG